MKVLFFAEGEILTLLNKIFKNDINYKVVGHTISLSELERIMGRHNKLLVLLEGTQYREQLNIQALSMIKNKKMKSVVLCDSVKEGFNLLSKGADDMCTLPKGDNSTELKSFFNNLCMKINKIYKAYTENARELKNRFNKKIRKVVAIGSSTGGTECILRILKDMPADAPPILIVQHMPPVFTKLYSKRLNNECKITVWEAQNGDVLEPGLALIAPGDQQMRLTMKNDKLIVNCEKGPPVSGHIPSVDALFDSVAATVGKNSLGVILTGMGKDGATGLLKMREAGAYTIGQDEESSIVYGMPKVAYDIGAVAVQSKPEKIASIILTKV